MKTADLWIRGGLVWLLVTMSYGTYLGLTEQFNLMSSHAHTGLLGGVWAMIFSWLYGRRGDPALTALSALQWAGWNLGVACMVTAFMLFSIGNPVAMGIAIPGVVLLLGSALWIAITVWPRRA